MTEDRPNTNPVSLDAVSAHLVPLGSTNPRAPFPHPGGLDAVLGDARVVGLGEATHGTRDIFRLKHRLIRYLVLEHDLRVVALESNFPETLAIDEYVVHGRGDPNDALDSIYFWTWNVEAILDLVEWLRTFNEGRPLDDRIRFYGIDAQYTTGAVDRIRAYFDSVDATLSADLHDDLETVDDCGTNPDRDEHIAERVAASKRVAEAIREELDECREAYVERTGKRAWHLARRHTTVIEQAAAYRQARVDRIRAVESDPGDGSDTDVPPEVIERLLRNRDRLMADNVDWLLGLEDAPIAVWGHDAHVNRSKHVVRDRDIETTPMGGHLADRHGSDYVAVGFSVGSGSFQAISETEDGSDYELRAYTVEEPRPGTIDAVLDELEVSPALLDVRAASDDERIADWFASPRETFSAGATYDPDSPDRYFTEYALDNAFDAICFVTGTTRARPIGTDG